MRSFRELGQGSDPRHADTSSRRIWWAKGVSERIRKKAEGRRDEEQVNRWHTPRGDDPLDLHQEIGNLRISIIRNNQDLFLPFFPSVEWVRDVVDVIERSRNVIMRRGVLSKPDIERLGVNIRDWVKQVGA